MVFVQVNTVQRFNFDLPDGNGRFAGFVGDPEKPAGSRFQGGFDDGNDDFGIRQTGRDDTDNSVIRRSRGTDDQQQLSVEKPAVAGLVSICIGGVSVVGSEEACAAGYGDMHPVARIGHRIAGGVICGNGNKCNIIAV